MRSQLAAAYCASRARQTGHRGQCGCRASAPDAISRRAGDHDRRSRRWRIRRRPHHGCGDLARTGVAGLDRFFVINIDHHPGNTGYGRLNWFERERGPRAASSCSICPRLERAADGARSRRPHLSRDPHRHRLVSLLEHLAAHLRHLPARRSRRVGSIPFSSRGMCTTATTWGV